MKKYNDLLSKEEFLYKELDRCSEQVDIFRYQLKYLINGNGISDGQLKQLNYYRQLFNYYHTDLIPALEETVRLGKKHIDLARKNPDKSFKPVKLEVKNHYKLIRQFFNRFEQVKREFKAFTDTKSGQ